MTEQSPGRDDLTARVAALQQAQAAMREVPRIISRSPESRDHSLEPVRNRI
jgi:hypothetical protein